MTSTLVLVWLFCEAVGWVGLVDYQRLFVPDSFEPWRKPSSVRDPELVWKPGPYERASGTTIRGNIGQFVCLPPHAPQPYALQYDGQGFRNERELSQAEIAVLGDSYVEAPMLLTVSIMTSILSERLQVPVVNLGLSGYGPPQELVVLKRYALPLHPRVIVWVFYEGNDLTDTLWYDTRREHVLRDAAHSDEPFAKSFTKQALSAILRLGQDCTPHRGVVQQYGIVQSPTGQPTRRYFLDAVLPLTAKDLQALDRIRGILAEAIELCRKQHIRMLVAFAPTDYRVYQASGRLTAVSEGLKRWQLNDLPARLGTMVTQLSSRGDYVDLTPIFAAELAHGTEVFLADDSHWTAEGHHVAARAIEAALRSSLVHHALRRPSDEML
jgi:hypothetical protein